MNADSFSDAQKHMLGRLYGAHRVNRPAAHSAKKRTLQALKRRGLVEEWRHPYFGCCWRLTDSGIDVAKLF